MLLSFITLLLSSCTSSKDLVIIPANGIYEVENSPKGNYSATLNKKNFTDVTVKVVSLETGEQVKGFGLGIAGDATVFVEKENKLILENTSDKKARIRTNYVSIEKKSVSIPPSPPKINSISSVPETPTKETNVYIEFTLVNKGLKSIPLIIPTVMNPNLSPVSRSGVSLKVGQEILFKYRGKKWVLLTVTSDIKNGDEIDVKSLLDERIEEIKKT
jgi:hypothetical protein